MITLKKYALSDTALDENATGIYLETCNRIEMYSGDGKASRKTVRHLFRLVCGLDSPILGENAIQGQVKRAYCGAASVNVNGGLHHLFQSALKVGKRVRTKTALARVATSYEKVVVQLLYETLPNLAEAHITIVGAHNMSENIIAYLTRKDAGTIFIANRTYNAAYLLARKYDAVALQFDQLKGALRHSDVVISATGAPHTVIQTADLPHGKRMVLVDLAVPHDIDSAVRDLSGVTLYRIGDIEAIAAQNFKVRDRTIAKAESIIENEIENYFIKAGDL